MRMLLVEYERKIADFVQRGLKERRYVVDAAYEADTALFLGETNPYDLIILDWVLPGKDGISLCRELRDKKISTPILMLSERSSVEDKVTGLDSGADDYLVKPFCFEEFLARVRALLRRKRHEINTLLKAGDIELDQLSHKVTRAGREISLTSKEYALLEYFMLHANQIITRTMISEHVWGENFDSFTNVIDVYVNYLRNKIDKGFEERVLYTIRGAGYILKTNSK